MGKGSYFLKDSDTYQVFFTGIKEELKALVSEALSPLIQEDLSQKTLETPSPQPISRPNWSYPTLESIPFKVSPPTLPNSKTDIVVPVKGSDLLFK